MGKSTTIITICGNKLEFGAGRIKEATFVMSGKEEMEAAGNMLAYFGKYKFNPREDGLMFETSLTYGEVKEYLKKVRGVVAHREKSRLMRQFRSL